MLKEQWAMIEVGARRFAPKFYFGNSIIPCGTNIHARWRLISRVWVGSYRQSSASIAHLRSTCMSWLVRGNAGHGV